MKSKTYSVLLLDAIIKLLLNRLVLQTGTSKDKWSDRSQVVDGVMSWRQEVM